MGSPHQDRAGIKDSVELMKEDMLRAGANLNHPFLLDKIIRESYDTVKWTEDEFGISYRERVTQMGGHSVPRTLSTMNHSGKIISPYQSLTYMFYDIHLITFDILNYLCGIQQERISSIQC